ncbi:hypothetical protein ACFIOY_13630 [Bradyrhizobium sp. TZ2]
MTSIIIFAVPKRVYPSEHGSPPPSFDQTVQLEESSDSSEQIPIRRGSYRPCQRRHPAQLFTDAAGYNALLLLERTSIIAIDSE